MGEAAASAAESAYDRIADLVRMGYCCNVVCVMIGSVHDRIVASLTWLVGVRSCRCSCGSGCCCSDVRGLAAHCMAECRTATVSAPHACALTTLQEVEQQRRTLGESASGSTETVYLASGARACPPAYCHPCVVRWNFASRLGRHFLHRAHPTHSSTHTRILCRPQTLCSTSAPTLLRF